MCCLVGDGGVCVQRLLVACVCVAILIEMLPRLLEYGSADVERVCLLARVPACAS